MCVYCVLKRCVMHAAPKWIDSIQCFAPDLNQRQHSNSNAGGKGASTLAYTHTDEESAHRCVHRRKFQIFTKNRTDAQVCMAILYLKANMHEKISNSFARRQMKRQYGGICGIRIIQCEQIKSVNATTTSIIIIFILSKAFRWNRFQLE